MKKYLFFFLVAAVFTLQSCSINTEITYFKDATSTSIIDIDAKEMIGFLNSKDSANIKGLGELEKLPKEWTSFYEMEKNEEKKIPQNPDSVKLMKKIFIKSKFDGDELSGISLKLDKFTVKEYEDFTKAETERKRGGNIPVNQDLLTNWTGKTLTINTSAFNLDSLGKTIGDDDSTKEATTPEEQEEQRKQTKAMMEMMKLKVEYKLIFESKIKEIKGRHDWIEQVDNQTIIINLDPEKLSNTNLKNKDKIITIITE